MKHTKQAIAFAMAFLLASAGVSQPIAFALPVFDASKSTVAYCSQPLKVPLGVGSDYQYFAYAAKVGPDDIFLNVDSGSVDSIENLYPGNHAWISGSQIRIEENTSFIIHSSSNLELKLSGNGLQLVSGEKCDAIVAVMLSAEGYGEQKAVENEDMLTAQIELINALAAATKHLGHKDVRGDIPSAAAPSSTFSDSVTTVMDYLNNNGLRGQPVLDEFYSLIAKNEGAFPLLKTKTMDTKIDVLLASYTDDLITEIFGQITLEQEELLTQFSESYLDSSKALSDAQMKQVLEIIVKEKIHKHPSRPGEWLTLSEYLNIENSDVGVEYKIIERPLNNIQRAEIDVIQSEVRAEPKPSASRYRIYAPDGNIAHLQIMEKATGAILSEVAILPDMYNPGAAGMTYTVDIYKQYPIITIDIDIHTGSLQGVAMTAIHEVDHATTKASGTVKKSAKLYIGDETEINPKNAPNEGSAKFAENRYAANQGTEGFKFSRMFRDRQHMESSKFSGRVAYFEWAKVFDYIYNKYGPGKIADIKAGRTNIDEIVDVSGLNSAFRASFVLPRLEQITIQADELLKIHKKEIEIKNAVFSGDIMNPDIAKLNSFIADLDALKVMADSHPDINSWDRGYLTRYAQILRMNLEDYRDAAIDQRVEKFKYFMSEGLLAKADAADYLSQKTGETSKFFGGLDKNAVPAAEYAAVESAAYKVLEKMRRIKQLRDITLKSKSLDALDRAEKSVLEGKVPKEMKSPFEEGLKLSAGEAAKGAGLAMFFSLGSKFAEYGEKTSNPYLVYTGSAVELSGLGLLALQAGGVIASLVNVLIANGLIAAGWAGLEVLTTFVFSVGAVLGLLAMFVIETLWCMFVDIFGCMYVQPTLTLSATKAFPGEKITYEVNGFNIPDGVGDQEGKQWLMWGPQMQLGSGCTVSGDSCKGEFDAPFVNSPIKVFAQDLNNQYRSASVVFGMLSSQLIITGTVGTDASYLCAYKDLWRGEPEVLLTCVAM